MKPSGPANPLKRKAVSEFMNSLWGIHCCPDAYAAFEPVLRSWPEIPASSGSPMRIARFGVFEVDAVAQELRKHGTRIGLQQQPFQVLVLLVERAGEVVTREELREQVWA